MSTFTKSELKTFSRYVTRVKHCGSTMHGAKNGMDIALVPYKYSDHIYRAEITVPYHNGFHDTEIGGACEADTIPAAVSGAKRDFRKNVRYYIAKHESTLRKLNGYL